jgi:hypothetical protein
MSIVRIIFANATMSFANRTKNESNLVRIVAAHNAFYVKNAVKTNTPVPKPQGYLEEVREKVVRMYVEGINFRRIGCLLGVNHQ